MSQFEKVPTALATDARISLQARAVYPILLAEAWKRGGRAGERIELPPLRELAQTAGCSVSALKNTYIPELKTAGWISTVRAARGRSQLYVIHAVRGPEYDPQDESRGPESNPRVGQNMTHSRARSSSSTDTKEPDTPPHPPAGGEVEVVDLSHPPPLRKQRVEGKPNLQDIALNALCEVCGIDPASNQLKVAVTAMNGKPPAKGIRELYWTECIRIAETRGDAGALALARLYHGDFEEHLASKVRAKAALILLRQPWRTSVSATHVRDLWLDIELQPEPKGRGLSSKRMETLR